LRPRRGRRDLSPAAGRKHRREARIRDQAEHLLGDRRALLLAPAVGIARELEQRGIEATLGDDVGP
jgi:hypothetical protein